MRIVVVGAGMAGLATALCLGRAKHSVLLLDRDPFQVADDPGKAFRRIGFLDPLSVFDNDRDLHRKIEQIAEKSLRSATPPKSICREELLAVVRSALDGNANASRRATVS